MTYKDLPKNLKEAYAWLDKDAKEYPLEWVDGVLRFKANKCVVYCVNSINLNELWKTAMLESYTKKDMQAFYRLMGYSLSGYGDIEGWNALA